MSRKTILLTVLLAIVVTALGAGLLAPTAQGMGETAKDKLGRVNSLQAATATPAAQGVTGAGLGAADAEKIINDKFNMVDRNLALWNIQPGLGTVMIEYGNRLARTWYAAQASNWDMAKYQLDEMIEIQEVGETTRPARVPMLKAFEENYLQPLDAAIVAKDKTAFDAAFSKTIEGCNSCHKASTGTDWKSYQYVEVQTPKLDPASYVDWKGAGQDNYIANPPAAAPTTPKPPLTGVVDAAGAQKLLYDKLNTVDRSLALWNIQPGLGTVMIEYGNRWSRMWYAAKAGNWDMAKYQLAEALEIQEVGEVTRPGRAPMLKAFEENFLSAVDTAIDAKDATAFASAFQKATEACNSCHKLSTGSNWKSYQFVKIQEPTADNSDHILWSSPRGTGNYIANPPVSPTLTPQPPLSGPIDALGVTMLISDTFGTVNRNLALWNIQPGLGTVMIEYGNRLARMSYAIEGGNWDMAKYQLDEMVEIQEVGETTRPGRSEMLKTFQANFLKPIDDAILAQDKTKAGAALTKAIEGCNACHAGSNAANWSSFAYVVIQLPKSDPADYLKWDTANGTGNYISAEANATPAASTGTTPPNMPKDHAGRTGDVCLVCHQLAK